MKRIDNLRQRITAALPRRSVKCKNIIDNTSITPAGLQHAMRQVPAENIRRSFFKSNTIDKLPIIPEKATVEVEQNGSANESVLKKTPTQPAWYKRLRYRMRKEQKSMFTETDQQFVDAYVEPKQNSSNIILQNKYTALLNDPQTTIDQVQSLTDDPSLQNKVLKKYTNGDPNIFDKNKDHKRIIYASTSCSTQTNSISISTDTDELNKSIDYANRIRATQEAFKALPYYNWFESLRTDVRKMKKEVKNVRANSELVFYLKCKHSFAPRTRALIYNMRSDARVWMTSNNYTLTTYNDYHMLTNAVMAAFKIDRQERKLLKLLSDVDSHNHIYDFNKFAVDGVALTKRCAPVSNYRGFQGLIPHKKKFKIGDSSI